MYVVSCVLPAECGAGYGRSAVLAGCRDSVEARKAVGAMLFTAGVRGDGGTDRFTLEVFCADAGVMTVHEPSGIAFRIDTVGAAPHACPCCGRLVLPGDHALAGSEDAYCLGCFTGGDAARIPCDPAYTAHANPWTTDTAGVRWVMEVIIGRDGETDSDFRYAATVDEPMWDGEDNALVAWPGLTREQIISVSVSEIETNEGN